MTNQTIKLSGLHCKACKILTERKIGKLKGVQSVNVDIDSQIAQLVTERVIEIEEVNKVLSGTEYKAI